MKSFLIIKKNNPNKSLPNSFIFGKYKILTNFRPIIVEKKNCKIFFFGTINGKINNNKIKNISEKKALNELIETTDIHNYVKNLEGRFIILIEKNNALKLITDKFSRLDVFFINTKNNFMLSNNFKLVCQNLSSLKIDQIAISHMINILGTKPAKKETIFKEINRLGVGEILELSTLVKIKKEVFKPKKTEEFGYEKIAEYYDIFSDYFKSLSKSKKTIFMSSGFDSSFLASMASKILGKNNIKGVTLKQKFSERSKIYNKFEIDRVKKIGEYLDIKIFYGEIDLNKNFHKYAEKFKDISANRMVPMTLAAIMHYELSKTSKKFTGSNELLSGEVSDGVHNFGFAQYANFFKHESNGLREYVDKMMNYLYSPSFFKKLKEGTYETDYVFQFLLELKKIDKKMLNKTKNSEKSKNEILTSLFLTDKRFPLLKDQSPILKKSKVKSIEKYYQKKYFSEIKLKDDKEIYSAYIHLYNSFHWQAGTVSTMYELPDHYNLKMTMPYWNPILHDYLSVMPENWGRGLETKTLKYPLKENLSKNFNIMNVLNLGPHSYQYDVNKFSDPFLEILISKSTKKYVTQVFDKYHPCDYLDNSYFNRQAVYKIIKGYKNDNFDITKASLTYRLFTLSNLLKDLDY
jgi:asparagine synthetase B (glutamine-hydrolysing)